MFKAGDTVVYSSQGVCRINEIVTKQVGKTSAEYYLLTPVYQENTTIFVPVDNEKLTCKMRSVLSRGEIDELILAMRECDIDWIKDDIARRRQYTEVLSSGDRLKIAALIKTLYLEQRRRKEAGKKLHIADEQLLKKAQTLLHNELALALQIEPEQVVSFIKEQMNASNS